MTCEEWPRYARCGASSTCVRGARRGGRGWCGREGRGSKQRLEEGGLLRRQAQCNARAGDGRSRQGSTKGPSGPLHDRLSGQISSGASEKRKFGECKTDIVLGGCECRRQEPLADDAGLRRPGVKSMAICTHTR
eukprot:356968-Chlamydomonas_euryale.AAC.1